MGRASAFPRITIHSDFYYRHFHAKRCSLGYFFSLAVSLLVLILPFLTTFGTGTFWPKVDQSLEQP